MTLLRNILVLANLALSFLFLGFAVVVYVTRVDLTNQLATAKSATSKVQSANAGLTQQMEDLNNQLKDQKEKAGRTESDNAKSIADLKKQIENLLAQLRDTKKDAAATLAEQGNATTEQVTRRKEVEELRKTRENLLQKNNELTSKNTGLQDKLAQTVNDLQLATARGEQMVTRIRELEGYVVRTQGTLPDEAALRAGQDVPPPPNVEGIVKRVDPSGKFVELSVGADDGFRKGQVLEVWRTEPEPKYVGRIRLELVEPNGAVAKPVRITGPILENDKVGPRINVHGN